VKNADKKIIAGLGIFIGRWASHRWLEFAGPKKFALFNTLHKSLGPQGDGA
jgi:hypothetical protein